LLRRAMPIVIWYAEMDTDFIDSLEALANLLYLIRKSLHDSPAASPYVDLAEERIKAIASHLKLPASVPWLLWTFKERRELSYQTRLLQSRFSQTG
jgi:hypothetical protein